MAKKPNVRKKGVRTAMSADPEEKNAANGELREGANVDKIRDILFGSNMREYEKRFARLEVGIELGRAGREGGGLPSSPFRSARRVHNSTRAAFPEAPPIMPDDRVSQVRFEALVFRP
jgi:hypothetical protein